MRFIKFIFISFLFLSVEFAWSQTAEEFVKIGVEKAKSGNHKEAIEQFDRAIKLNPKDFKAYQYRAYAKDALKDYKGAIEDYNKAIELSPNNAELYYNMALVKYTSGDKKTACKDWQKAIDLGMQEAIFIIQMYCN